MHLDTVEEAAEKLREQMNACLEKLAEEALRKDIAEICAGRLTGRTLTFEDHQGGLYVKISRRGGRGHLVMDSTVYSCGVDFYNEKGQTCQQLRWNLPVIVDLGQLMNAYNRICDGFSCEFTMELAEMTRGLEKMLDEKLADFREEQ